MSVSPALMRHFIAPRDPALAALPAMEPIYRALFLRELERLEEADIFHPVGGAANHSLLYLIARLADAFRPQAVLDIGAGQSSLLWSTLRRRGLVGDVTTLEGDPDWGARIGALVSHPVTVTPPTRQRICGRWHQSYDWTQVAGPFDVVVCDGPNGVPRHSRGGVLALIEQDALAPDFALILDDAERPGEQDTVCAIHRALIRRGVAYRAGVTRAANTQVVFAAGRMLPATYW